MSVFDKIRRRTPSLYTDFDIAFTANPVTGDLVTISDEVAIKQSLKNLVLTNFGERVMQPELGSDLTSQLFELATPSSIRVIREKVMAVIRNFEPRIELIDVEVVSVGNSIKVNVIYYLRNREDAITTTIFLERTR